jgi:hypothetical protein
VPQIPCPERSHDISDRTARCPKCGIKQSQPAKIVLFYALATGIFLVAATTFGAMSAQGSAAMSAPSVPQPAETLTPWAYLPIVLHSLPPAPSNSWSSAGSMSTPRWGHSATLLASDRVLVAAPWPVPSCTIRAATVGCPRGA